MTGRAAGYVRISHVGARAGDSFLSPEIQRERIEAWASYRGFEIVEWYTDLDRPAKEGDPRPDFERMMTDAAASRFEMVAVFRLSRFARSVSDAARRYSELRRLGVGLASVTEDFDTSTASGELIQNMLFAMAEFESRRIGEEWAGVHAARRRKGIAHVTRPMFGYEIEKGTLAAVIPEEAEAVRMVFSMRLGGESYARIRERLESEGFRPRGGGRLFATTSLAHMLANPLYAGLVRSGDELVEGRHEAIVTPAEWEAVTALKSRQNAQGRFRVGLLSGLIVCASCGYRMSHNAGHGRWKSRYRCSGVLNANGCERPTTILREKIDSYVERRVLRRLDTSRMPNRGKLARRPDRRERIARQALARVEELNRALDALADARFVKGSLEAAEHERQLARLLAEREEAEGRANEARALAAVRSVDVDALSIWPRLDLAGKQRLLRTQIDRVVVAPYGNGASTAERTEIVWIA